MADSGPKKPGWAEQLASLLNIPPAKANLVRWVAILLFLGVLYMTFGDYLGLSRPTERPTGATEVTAQAAPQDELVRMERETAQDLESTLSQIQGAGQVHVKVTLESGPAVAAVTDTRVEKSTNTEKATDQSTRTTDTTNTTSTNVVVKSGGQDALAVAKKTRAQVAGVIVVADGARDPSVKALIFQATVRALGVPANRVDVYPAEGR